MTEWKTTRDEIVGIIKARQGWTVKDSSTDFMNVYASYGSPSVYVEVKEIFDFGCGQYMYYRTTENHNRDQDTYRVRVQHSALRGTRSYTDRRTVHVKNRKPLVSNVYRALDDAERAFEARRENKERRDVQETEKAVVGNAIAQAYGIERVRYGPDHVDPEIHISRREGESVADFGVRAAEVLAGLHAVMVDLGV